MQENIKKLANDLNSAIQTTQYNSKKWQAWESLNQIDENNVSFVKPYSDEMFSILEEMYNIDESDGDVIHHLAIAYHAKAWDFELQESDMASSYWERSLFYWRKLQSCGKFWQELIEKGKKVSNEFDENQIKLFRQNLFVYLLEIHANLIKHYLDLNKPAYISKHINIIKKARISPAVRKKLEDLVYKIMTANIPDIVEAGLFKDALNILNNFLNIFPSNLYGLQTYIEIAKQWLDQLSPADHWKKICELTASVLSCWNSLIKLLQTQDQPLALVVLNDFAKTAGNKYFAYARSLQLNRQKKSKKSLLTIECDEFRAYVNAILWFKNMLSCCYDTTEAEINLSNAISYKVQFLNDAGLNNNNIDLLEQAASDCEEAIKFASDKTIPQKNLSIILINKIRLSMSKLSSGFNKEENKRFIENLKNDLEKAMQFDPDNEFLKDLKRQLEIF